jgi:hypothetical protein
MWGDVFSARSIIEGRSRYYIVVSRLDQQQYMEAVWDLVLDSLQVNMLGDPLTIYME